MCTPEGELRLEVVGGLMVRVGLISIPLRKASRPLERGSSTGLGLAMAAAMQDMHPWMALKGIAKDRAGEGHVAHLEAPQPAAA